MTVRHRDAMTQDRVAADQLKGWLKERTEGLRDEAGTAGQRGDSHATWMIFVALVSRLSREVPEEFLDGISEITVSPRAVPHPTRADIFTLGHCIPFHAGETGAPDEIQSRVVLYHGSFRALAELDPDVRLADRGLGDAHPRAPAPPRVAGPRGRARGLRRGGGAELRAERRRSVRLRVSPGRRPGGGRRVPGGRRLLPRPRGPDACRRCWNSAGTAARIPRQLPAGGRASRLPDRRGGPATRRPATWSLVLRRRAGMAGPVPPSGSVHGHRGGGSGGGRLTSGRFPTRWRSDMRGMLFAGARARRRRRSRPRRPARPTGWAWSANRATS